MLKSKITGLRALEVEDLTLLRDWRNTESMRRFFRETRELNMYEQQSWFNRMAASRTDEIFVIERLDDSVPVGVCGLTNINWIVRSAEISFYIGYQSKYIDEIFAPDALLALLTYAFNTLGFQRIWAEVYAFDSLKAELLGDIFGFRRDGVLRAATFAEGRHHDSHIYSLLRHEFSTHLETEVRPAPIDWDYYQRQYETPYRSTAHACDFLEDCGAFKTEGLVLDIGAGSGSVLAYFAKRHPQTRFLGLDSEKAVVEFGNDKLQGLGLTNARLEHGDLFTLEKDQFGLVDGVFSSHFILLFEDFRIPLDVLIGLSPRWIAANSLFFDGRVQAVTTRYDYNVPIGHMPYQKATYATFSLPLYREYLQAHGYYRFEAAPFDIDTDLPKTAADLGTYTVRTDSGQRLQFSGPMYMPWHFTFSSKEE